MQTNSARPPIKTGAPIHAIRLQVPLTPDAFPLDSTPTARNTVEIMIGCVTPLAAPLTAEASISSHSKPRAGVIATDNTPASIVAITNQ